MPLIAFVIFLIVFAVVLLSKAIYWIVWGPVLLVSAKQREKRRQRLALRKAVRDLSRIIAQVGRPR
jgi:predicted membrane protein